MNKTDPAEIGVKPHVSPSAMDTYDKCAMGYKYKYVDRLPRMANVPMILGGATHTAAEKDLRSMLDTGLLLSGEEVRDNARDALRDKWDTSGDILFSEDEKASGVKAIRGAAIDLTVDLAMLHHSELAPDLFPTHVEHKFRLVVKGYPYDIVGILDVREEIPVAAPRVQIRDLKTSGKAPPQQDADRSEQLTVYALWERQAHGKAPDGVFLDALVKNKVPKLVSRESTRNDYDFRTFLLRMEKFCDALGKGAFVPCDPTGWICTPKWCGYYDTCPFGQRKRIQG